ncbi:hypothetical protein BC781_103170 [Sediminitomix flava]|uniref:WD40 repeat protein n=2 Tax=Sediminitomix flava TaxID=379075 RepID=A0A315Z954_SEDFL|nr:hypothetical protein BC781_103170 [Sediminitomix flava]
MIMVTSAMAQEKKVTKLNVKGYRVALAPDGSGVVYTSPGLIGLKHFDFSSKKETVLSKARGAGYQPSFYEGEVVFKERTNKTVLKRASLTSNASKTISTTGVSPKKWAKTQVMSNKRVSKKEVSYASTSETLNDFVVAYSDGSEKRIAPFGDQEDYIWVSLSPDKTKVLFKLVGVSAYVCDLKGKILHDLGDLENPKWVTNDKIVYMITEEDHDSFTKSDIYTISIAQKERKNLTKGMKQIALYPDMVGDQVVFNTPEGDIYLMEVSQ